jgi:splicing factor 3B subunit 3
LLKKYDNRNFKSTIVRILSQDDKVYVADTQQSVKVLKFKPEMGLFYVFADDVINRWVTNFCLLDEDTMAGVDKFENFFVNRLPPGSEDDAEDDPTIQKINWESGYLGGA